jgi:hypothetical protein
MSYSKALNIFIQNKINRVIEETKECFCEGIQILGMLLLFTFMLFTFALGFPTLLFELFVNDITSIPIIKGNPNNHQFEIYCHSHKIMIKLYGTILLSSISLYLIKNYWKNELISVKQIIFSIIASILCLFHIFRSNNNIYNNFLCVLWCVLSIVICYFCYLYFQKYKEKAKNEIEEIEKTIMV